MLGDWWQQWHGLRDRSLPRQERRQSLHRLQGQRPGREEDGTNNTDHKEEGQQPGSLLLRFGSLQPAVSETFDQTVFAEGTKA